MEKARIKLTSFLSLPPFHQVQYEQRCSQLVGLALCTMNFTGKYPEYVRLRGTCYAIRALGETYLMVRTKNLHRVCLLPSGPLYYHCMHVHEHGCGVVVAQRSELQWLKLEALGSIPGGCPRISLFQPTYFPLFTELDNVCECSSTGGPLSLIEM